MNFLPTCPIEFLGLAIAALNTPPAGRILREKFQQRLALSNLIARANHQSCAILPGAIQSMRSYLCKRLTQLTVHAPLN